MRIVNIHEAKTQLSRLLDQVQAGEEVVLAKAGKPYARLVPVEQPKRRLGFMPGHVDAAFFDALPAQERDAWESE